MKFLIDAHLPPALCQLLERHGHDAVHTLGLPDQNETKDRAINQVSMEQERVVVSKDSDFFYSHVLQGRPWKLLLVQTGNISTRDLATLFERHVEAIIAALQSYTLVEIDRSKVTPIRP